MHCMCCIEVRSLHWGQGGKELLIPCCGYPSQAGKKRTSCYTSSKEILPLHPLIKTVSLSSNKTVWKSAFEYFFPSKVFGQDRHFPGKLYVLELHCKLNGSLGKDVNCPLSTFLPLLLLCSHFPLNVLGSNSQLCI